MRLNVFLIAIFFVFAVFSASVQASCRRRKRVVIINPPTLLDPTDLGFSQISLDTKNAVAYIAGQVSFNLTGAIIGTTLAEQLRVVKENIRLAMEAVGAGNDDILRVNVYVKDYKQARDLPVVSQFAIGLGSPVSTLASTPSLFLEQVQVEVDVTVAVPYRVVKKFRCM